MTPVEIIGLVGGSSVLASLLTGIVNSWAGRARVRVDRFEAEVAALNIRINDLKDQVAKVETSLATERTAHETTQRRLRKALGYIRDMLSWLGGARTTEPPSVPLELADEL